MAVTWRVGLKVPEKVFAGDLPVCECYTAAEAALIVKAVNLYNRMSVCQECGGRGEVHVCLEGALWELYSTMDCRHCSGTGTIEPMEERK